MKKSSKKIEKTENKEIVYINVIEVKENKDGSATVTFEASEDVMDMLLREGLCLSLSPENRKKIMVVAPDKYKCEKYVKQIEITEEEMNAFIEIAVIDILKRYLKEKEKC